MTGWRTFVKSAQPFVPLTDTQKEQWRGAAGRASDWAGRKIRNGADWAGRKFMGGLGAATGFMSEYAKAVSNGALPVPEVDMTWGDYARPRFNGSPSQAADAWKNMQENGKAGWEAGNEWAPTIFSGMAEGARDEVPDLLDTVGMGGVARKVQSLTGYNMLMNEVADWQRRDLEGRFGEIGEEKYPYYVAESEELKDRVRPAGGFIPYIVGMMPVNLAAKASTLLKYLGRWGKGVKNGLSKAAPYFDFIAPIAYHHGKEVAGSMRAVSDARDELVKVYDASPEWKRRFLEKQFPFLAAPKSHSAQHSAIPGPVRLHMGGL